MKISTIIPTRNRAGHVVQVLQTLQKQTRPSDEIIIIDASDDKSYSKQVQEQFNTLPLRWIDAPLASVCVQRNTGIQAALGDWIFLCDDDIVLKADYLEKLEQYAESNLTCGAMAGRLLQLENGNWIDEYPVTGFADLLWRFTFQLSIWGDLENIKVSFPASLLLRVIKKFYASRKNGLTLGGWPLITSWNSTAFQTTIYSLGANVIRRDWLLHSPYDEVLDPSGIGDNYGVAIGFPQTHSIHVIGSTAAYHHRATENRLDRTLAYYRRVLALHYFIRKSKKYNASTVFWYIWSLTGNALMALFKRDWRMVRINLRVIRLIFTGKNPYWLAYNRNEKIIRPVFED